MNNQDSKLTGLYGAGWQFPLTFILPNPSPSDDRSVPWSTVAMSEGAQNVAQSLKMLFQTQPGERIMRPGYGCDMQSAVFSNMSEGTLSALHSRIAESVARYESRAEGVVVDVRQDTMRRGTLRVEVTYRLLGQTQQVTGQLNVLDGTDIGGGSWATSW